MLIPLLVPPRRLIFLEFDVAAATGAIIVNDDGDAGNISIEGTILDINSLDFVGAGTFNSRSPLLILLLLPVPLAT